jgi:arylformamidase
MLYRGMDRTQLDTAYNNTAAVPERDAIVAGWAARSARVRRERSGHFDLAYGDSPRERLDLFLAADPKAPTLAFIHGGYWQMNDKEGTTFLAEGVLPHGINFALIEYTLAPAARLDRIVAEVRRAALWLAEHLGDYGADPARLYVSGHSAGGHLTASTMTLPAVRGGLAISGLYDLEPIRLNYLNEKLRLDEAGGRAQQSAAAHPTDGRRACRRLRHTGIARAVPAIDRLRASLGGARPSRPSAASRRRRSLHHSRYARRSARRAGTVVSCDARRLSRVCRASGCSRLS